MAGYGYTYRSFSTYSTVGNESRGPVIKPFVPSVPNTNSNSEGYVTKKTIVPVTSRPYSDDYPLRSDGSPPKVDESLTKVQNEASRPARFSPVTSTDRRQSPQPTTYNNGAKGYGDYGSNKERSKPIGGNIRNDNYDGYNGTNGYGDYGNSYGNKEGRKPIGSTIRNDNYDGYNGTDGYTDGYGDYGNSYGNKEGRKPIGSTIRNDNCDGYNGTDGYGDYGNSYGNNKEERKPVGTTIRNDNYDGYNGTNGYGGYGDYNNKEGHKPASSPIRNDNYDGYNGANNGYGGYGNYKNKEGHRPFGSTTRNDNYDGYNGGNNGYGDYGSCSNKEGYKPSGSPILNDNYDRHRPSETYSTAEPNKTIPGGWTRPKISTAWTASPRKGTQLSEPTNDIDKAMELLKEAAKLNDHSNKGGHKTTLPYDNYDDYQRRRDEPTSKFSKGMELVKEAERLKNIVTGTPQSRSSVLMEPSTPNKDYGDATRRDDTRRYGNASIIDSREAEKKYKGRRI